VESGPEICVPVPQTYFVKESELYKYYNGFKDSHFLCTGTSFGSFLCTAVHMV